MSIEKKSLISNRIASKKAIVTKPEGSKVASNKTILARTSAVPKVLARSAVITKVISPTSKVMARIAVGNRLKLN